MPISKLAFAPPLKAAIEVEAALAVGVKYVPFKVPLLKEAVFDAVPVAFTVVDDVFEAPFVEFLWLVDDAWLVDNA